MENLEKEKYVHIIFARQSNPLNPTQVWKKNRKQNNSSLDSFTEMYCQNVCKYFEMRASKYNKRLDMSVYFKENFNHEENV